MYPIMEILYSVLHIFLILAPCYPIHSRRSLSLQQIKAVQQSFPVHMMQQRREP
jgi:hypothetical protein